MRGWLRADGPRTERYTETAEEERRTQAEAIGGTAKDGGWNKGGARWACRPTDKSEKGRLIVGACHRASTYLPVRSSMPFPHVTAALFELVVVLVITLLTSPLFHLLTFLTTLASLFK